MFSVNSDLGIPEDYIVSLAPQGSEEWLDARVGCITGSRAIDARDRLADKPEKIDKRTGEITPFKRGEPSKRQLLYAMDLGRARHGGRNRQAKFQTSEMREGQTEEPLARMAYEVRMACLVEQVGFICTPDRKFGVSLDGIRLYLANDNRQVRGAIEIKTMLSSDTLFTAVVFGDYSAYMDQIQMSIWLLALEWVDLVLWAPDLEGEAKLTVRRIDRDDDYINELVSDLIEFDGRVEGYRKQLADFVGLANGTSQPVPTTAPAPAAPAAIPAANAVTPTALPELF
jgi:exodeoxyribonuclease (lambda-induced)